MSAVSPRRGGKSGPGGSAAANRQQDLERQQRFEQYKQQKQVQAHALEHGLKEDWQRVLELSGAALESDMMVTKQTPVNNWSMLGSQSTAGGSSLGMADVLNVSTSPRNVSQLAPVVPPLGHPQARSPRGSGGNSSGLGTRSRSVSPRRGPGSPRGGGGGPVGRTPGSPNGLLSPIVAARAIRVGAPTTKEPGDPVPMEPLEGSHAINDGKQMYGGYIDSFLSEVLFGKEHLSEKLDKRRQQQQHHPQSHEGNGEAFPLTSQSASEAYPPPRGLASPEIQQLQATDFSRIGTASATAPFDGMEQVRLFSDSPQGADRTSPSRTHEKSTEPRGPERADARVSTAPYGQGLQQKSHASRGRSGGHATERYPRVPSLEGVPGRLPQGKTNKSPPMQGKAGGRAGKRRSRPPTGTTASGEHGETQRIFDEWKDRVTETVGWLHDLSGLQDDRGPVSVVSVPSGEQVADETLYSHEWMLIKELGSTAETTALLKESLGQLAVERYATPAALSCVSRPYEKTEVLQPSRGVVDVDVTPLAKPKPISEIVQLPDSELFPAQLETCGSLVSASGANSFLSGNPGMFAHGEQMMSTAAAAADAAAVVTSTRRMSMNTASLAQQVNLALDHRSQQHARRGDGPDQPFPIEAGTRPQLQRRRSSMVLPGAAIIDSRRGVLTPQRVVARMMVHQWQFAAASNVTARRRRMDRVNMAREAYKALPRSTSAIVTEVATIAQHARAKTDAAPAASVGGGGAETEQGDADGTKAPGQAPVESTTTDSSAADNQSQTGGGDANGGGGGGRGGVAAKVLAEPAPRAIEAKPAQNTVPFQNTPATGAENYSDTASDVAERDAQDGEQAEAGGSEEAPLMAPTDFVDSVVSQHRRRMTERGNPQIAQREPPPDRNFEEWSLTMPSTGSDPPTR